MSEKDIREEQEWERRWEKESLCNFCKNDCVIRDFIVETCPNFKENIR